MADNKRFVSYMYEYKNDEKLNSVGYARVESRSSQCKVLIHIDLAGQEGQLLKAYMFYRKPAKSRFAYLGNILVRNGVGEIKVKSDRDNVMNSNLDFDNFGGIIVYNHKDTFFACEWDDITITQAIIEHIENPDLNGQRGVDISEQIQKNIETESKAQEEIKVVDYKGEAVESIQEEEVEKEPSHDVIVKENIGVEEKRKPWDLPEAEKGISEANREASATIEAPTYENRDYYKDRSVIQEDTSYRNIPYEAKEEVKIVELKQQSMDGILPCVQPTFGTLEYDILQLEEEENIEDEDQSYVCHPIATNIFRRFPKVYPFKDNEIVDCVRIEPQDIGLLPIEAWVLGNNSFLLHGYYTYRHLIFGKIKGANEWIYILGVPGVYHNRESFMARMFGFDYFKATKLGEDKNGEFGYYYVPIQLG